MTIGESVTPGVTWVFICMILYWGYCIYWGIRGVGEATSARHFFIAGGNLGPVLLVLAVTATSFSGWVFMGDPGLIYTDGLQYGYAETLSALTMTFTAVAFMKRQWIIGRHFGFITPGEMLGYYFRSDLIRLLVVLVAVLFSVPYVGLQLKAAGFLFSVLTDGLLGTEFGMWVLSVVVLSYVATGGLRTVAQVDALQAVLLGVGIVVLGAAVLILVGGWETLMTGLATLIRDDPVRTPAGHSHYAAVAGLIQFVGDSDQAVGGAWTASMVLSSACVMLGIMAAPAFTMWAFASRSAGAFAPQQVWASALVMGFVLIVFTMIQGIGPHFLGADRDFLEAHPELVNPVLAQALDGRDLLAVPGQQDMLVPRLIHLLGERSPWLMGLLAVAALAAMQSTAACYMITTAGMLTRDLLMRFLVTDAEDRTQRFAGRLCVMLVLVLALVVASTATDALALLGGLAAAYGFQMWPALIAACYWPFLTRQGVAAGLVVGLVVVTLTDSTAERWLGITAWGRWPLTIHPAAWGMVFNLGTAVLVSLFTRDDGARKREFHDLLRTHATLPPSRRRLVPWAWAAVLVWAFFALGPGVVVGNTAFGDPARPESWILGMPSLWAWLVLWWLLGVALVAFLAYHMRLSTAPPGAIRPRGARPRIRLRASAWDRRGS